MIISRTPLRISFVGGGSDLASYYLRHGGAVISTTIDKYVFVTVNRKFDNGIRISYSQTENVRAVSEIAHPIVRAALRMLDIDGGLEITTIADIPSSGTGLGSSSSFTVGLLAALHAYKGEYVDAAQLAQESCRIEIDICGAPIGKQDQYAAAFGGFNEITFHRDDHVTVRPLIASSGFFDELHENLLLLYTGRTRSANEILSRQSKESGSSAKTQKSLNEMVEQTRRFTKALDSGEIDKIGHLLNEAWQLKRSLTTGISDSELDEWYDRAIRAGALGGKILGAGAGGVFLFYAPKEKHAAICHVLPDLKPVSFRFERSGSGIIFYRP